MDTDLAPLDVSPPALAAAIDAIEDAAGGRDALRTVFALVPVTDSLQYAINLIADPRHDARKLSTICQRANIHVGELIEAYKRGLYARMQLEVAQTISAKTPDVVDDVITRAAPHLVECSVCHGTQTVRTFDGKADEPCACTRTSSPGQQLVLPDVQRQKLALDLAHLMPKASPMAVIDNRSVTLGDASPAGFATLLKAADAVLRRTPPPARVDDRSVIDAVPVDAPAESP